MSATGPAVVVPACDRPRSLARLLASLCRIEADGPVSLVVSVDGTDRDVLSVAEKLQWPHGPKRVQTYGRRLGLRRHILRCGDLTREYGSVLVLEDDLYVSPQIHRYATAAVRAYGEDDRVAGISTYAYRVDEISGLPFVPLREGYDTFFLRFASSWGQVWTRPKWQAFSAWWRRQAAAAEPSWYGVPDNVAAWRNSWKKHCVRYLVETGRTFAYPYRSLSTNTCERGVNMTGRERNTITPLVRGCDGWRFAPLDERAIAYDPWFEPTPGTLAARWPELGLDDADVDLRGVKPPGRLTRDRLLSCRDWTAPPDATFPLLLLPLEENLALPGEYPPFFALGPRAGRLKITRDRWSLLFDTLAAQVAPAHARAVLARES